MLVITEHGVPESRANVTIVSQFEVRARTHAQVRVDFV